MSPRATCDRPAASAGTHGCAAADARPARRGRNSRHPPTPAPCPRSRTMDPITLDPDPSRNHPLQDVTCSQTAKPPPPTVLRHATELEVWEAVDWVGLRIIACEGEGLPS